MHRSAVIATALWFCSLQLADAQRGSAPACAPNNDGLTLPAGFCVAVVADSVLGARHIVVAPNGDLYVAVTNRGRGANMTRGGIVLLRDANGDGKFETFFKFGENGGNGIALKGNSLYLATNDAVLRYTLRSGELNATVQPDTIVRELPADRSHTAKTIVLGRGNELFVNIGSPTNSCQNPDRQNRVPGQDPCPDLQTRAGVWLFDATKLNQKQSDGTRYATGMRNMVALTLGPDGQLYGVQHGRDQLAANWGFSPEYSNENPAEIFMRIGRGDDYGWPYCYFSNETNQQVLAPEYGGDGKQQGRCAQAGKPLAAFPGHWAPNAVAFYTGTQFPAKYRGGVFIAFHGSWNRTEQQGFNVVFTPMTNGRVSGSYEVFADGFAGPGKAQGRAVHRPTGLAVAPDGSLYITADAGGRIYRVFYGR